MLITIFAKFEDASIDKKIRALITQFEEKNKVIKVINNYSDTKDTIVDIDDYIDCDFYVYEIVISTENFDMEKLNCFNNAFNDIDKNIIVQLGISLNDERFGGEDEDW